MKSREIELLAPARDATTAIAAINHGADAVYIGASHHGARSAAGNSLDDIFRVVDYAHQFDAKVYVTVNTLVYDDEITAVENLVSELYRGGVDALIVQDMSLLKMSLPPIALHASTQCDIRTPEKAKFLEDAGFSQIVLARELTLQEIKAIREVTNVPLEAFVHGALCVSYSGNCQASYMLTGRSANRGECAQICRYAFDLIDGDGRMVIKDKHLLSLKDMNRIGALKAMINAGVSSFKIEGRLKDVAYVKTVTAAYRKALDSIIDASDGALRRASIGKSKYEFQPRLEGAFNRGYTEYFLQQRKIEESIASFYSPKSIGQEIGRVKQADARKIVVSTSEKLNNGDGFSFFDRNGKLKGFRANRAEGGMLYPATPVRITPGTRLYRNFDAQYELMMSKETAERKVGVEMILRSTGAKRVALDIRLTEQPDVCVTATADCELAVAQQPQEGSRRAALSKTGDTIYSVDEIKDEVGEQFVPVSIVTKLRREGLDLLNRSRRMVYKYDYKSNEKRAAQLWSDKLVYNDNVANRLAEAFYKEMGARKIQPAVEIARLKADRCRVMRTRYCLRRELGYCLQTGNGTKLKGPLKLHSANAILNLEFDCKACEMSVYLAENRK